MRHRESRCALIEVAAVGLIAASCGTDAPLSTLISSSRREAPPASGTSPVVEPTHAAMTSAVPASGSGALAEPSTPHSPDSTDSSPSASPDSTWQAASSSASDSSPDSTWQAASSSASDSTSPASQLLDPNSSSGDEGRPCTDTNAGDTFDGGGETQVVDASFASSRGETRATWEQDIDAAAPVHVTGTGEVALDSTEGASDAAAAQPNSSVPHTNETRFDGTAETEAAHGDAGVVHSCAPRPGKIGNVRVPHDFSTIQAAIDAATGGDIVSVDSGTYYERVDFKGKAVELVSENGPECTVLDGEFLGPVVTIETGEGPSSVLQGFTLRNGSTSGGGITMGLSSPTIRGNVFIGDERLSVGMGAAIWGNVASPRIESNVFMGYTCDDQYLSGVVVIVNASSPNIVNNVFLDNACPGVNVTMPTNAVPEVSNNTFVGNKVGIRVDARTYTFNQIYRNNLIVNGDVGLEVVFGSASTIPTWSHNLVHGNATNYVGIDDQTGSNGNISADPRLVGAQSGNVHLLQTSPAIEAGTDVGPPLADLDMDGEPRVLAVQVDIGADEYLGSELPPDDAGNCDGDVTFRERVRDAVSWQPTTVLADDLDGNGWPDLLVTGVYQQTLNVAYNRGNWSFDDVVTYGSGGHDGAFPMALASGDLDEDGFVDIAVANPGNDSVAVVLNAGDGTLLPAVDYATGKWNGYYSAPTQLSLFDANQDGHLDLVAANALSSNVVTFLNDGSGSLEPAISSETGGASGTQAALASGDFDGDGQTDVAVLNAQDHQLRLLLGDGDGTFHFHAAHLTSDYLVYALVAADFDRSGSLDLAVADYAGDTILIYLNDGHAELGGPFAYDVGGHNPANVACVDFNLDGWTDLATSYEFGDNVSILFNQGDGSFGSPTNYVVGRGARDLYATDFNGDGRPDLAVLNEGDVTVSVLENLCLPR